MCRGLNFGGGEGRDKNKQAHAQTHTHYTVTPSANFRHPLPFHCLPKTYLFFLFPHSLKPITVLSFADIHTHTD